MSESLPPLPSDAPGPFTQWRHYKGDVYTVITVARHSETKEPMVVYAHDADIWCRPLTMWYEKVGDAARFTEIPKIPPRTLRDC